MKKTQPSNLEMQVLSVLWAKGPLGAREVLEELPDKKERAYTTVLTVLQVMEKKRLVRHEADGNRHIYIPLAKQADVLGSYLKGIVSNVFGGSASNAMLHMLENTPVSETELKEMRALLDAYIKKR